VTNSSFRLLVKEEMGSVQMAEANNNLLLTKTIHIDTSEDQVIQDAIQIRESQRGFNRTLNKRGPQIKPNK
jgi:hypothetical protein